MQEENFRKITCADARNYDMVSYLAQLSIEPHKIRGNNYWYYSPLRPEKTPSFKVNRKLNRWYDFGEGEGGNLVDFGIRYHQCSVAEFLRMLSAGSFSVHQPPAIQSNLLDQDSAITIIGEQLITSPSLISYIQSRGIQPVLAQQYCREVHFQVHGKPYYAIGQKNNSGGYELRNPYFKGSSLPKDFLTIVNGSPELSVFEGKFDFLSFLQLGLNDPVQDFLILNSVSLFERAMSVMDQYQTVNHYLDNDLAGEKCRQKALLLGPKYIDQKHLYAGYKDLNRYLVDYSPKLSMKQKPG